MKKPKTARPFLRHQPTYEQQEFSRALGREIKKNGINSVGLLKAVEDLEPDKVYVIINALLSLGETDIRISPPTLTQKIETPLTVEMLLRALSKSMRYVDDPDDASAYIRVVCISDLESALKEIIDHE